jgi:hypothetical protein
MSAETEAYEKLGVFYLGRPYDLAKGETRPEPLLYDSRDLLTHALCVGMTGSGKTGLCISLLEEAAIDGVPALVIDPKGDLANLLLTFPNLAPADFAPWVDPAEAERKGLSVDDFAAKQAKTWQDGLAGWAQSGERIARLRQAADFAVYTPGSEAGLPVSILASLGAPPEAVRTDADLLRDRVGTLVASLLSLLGINADPVRSREHILLSTLFDQAWRAGQDLDLATLIQQIQKPPISRIGVLELESFFPAGERFQLAMQLNSLLAAPGFQSWLQGDPLDVDKLLYTKEGKPRIAIFSIAHLSDPERMFFVTLLLSQTLGWMRSKPGTTSLRALLYMDEIFGYFPPVAEPPSKRPLLTLLKQARAFGLGLVLATQNPVDLDYKGLANIGTWFLGRLQTERDKARLLEGLEGASGGKGFDRGATEAILAGLGNRIFYLHNVHEDAPVVFQSRWALSYLRGPLTRPEIKRLMDPVKAGTTAPATSSVSPAPAAVAGSGVAPVLPPEVTQVFLPLRSRPEGIAYQPALLGFARVHYNDAKTGISHAEDLALLAPLQATGTPLDWYAAGTVEVAEGDLEREPAAGAGFAALPDAAARAKSYPGWSRDLEDCLYRSRHLDLLVSPTLGATAQPGESERDFRIRLTDQGRERRDAEVAKLRDKYGDRAAKLEERMRRAEQAREKQGEQASQQKLQTAISFGTTVLGALFGRKLFSTSTLGKASSAVKGIGRSMKESQDVTRAEENIAALQQELQAVNAELQQEVDQLEKRFDPSQAALETVSLKPKKSDVEARSVYLAWVPYRGGEAVWG